ncbi:Insulin-like growth factor binding protein, N-terminal [Pseudocohnilembus persalinus]|uniref:Insulin-like growth factor binding protein, N-terminal n=1 Tax=Pseudocohnilembus persalinus TaxID=266149 RepID=A0A0V0QZ23_PSEPJ|nr:Insulin-like growth factor binding protein, N-terminal [Pseudocohnilembus persalinus]|eukprot:KRX07476.1 Insulin-like growth factor binding protein, N-terminal [Pseudocohnilembus persalinus]
MQESDVNGWTITKEGLPQLLSLPPSCYQGYFLGRFYNGFSATKTFSSLPPHYSIHISVYLAGLFTWTNDAIYLNLDGTTIFNTKFQTGNYPMKDSSILQTMCAGASLNFYNGMYLQISQNVTHTSDTANLLFTSDMTSLLVIYGWWGLSNLVISVDTCHESCKTCSGPEFNQCTSCPDNSIDYSATHGICRCEAGYLAFENQCQLLSSCSSGLTQDFYKKTCDQDCQVKNCLTCSSQNECTVCESGYKLLYGECADTCPQYSTEIGNNCIYNMISSLSQPVVAVQQLMNQQFSYPDVKNKGWIPNKTSFSVSNTYEWTNYAMRDCGGYSYAFGQNFYDGGCSDGCSFSNLIENLPPHYEYYFNLVLIYGDNWNSDILEINIDNQEVYQKIYTANSLLTSDICGSFDGKPDYVEQITLGPISHTGSTLDISIDVILDQHLEEKWIGFRELSIIVESCMDYCETCSDASSCDTCIASRKNAPACDQPADGYFDDGTGSLEFQKCDFKCATCSSTSDNCLSCSDPNSSPPNCGGYDACINWMKVESGNISKGSYHNQFINGINQNYATSLGMGFAVFDEQANFIEFQNFNTAQSYLQTQLMVTFIDNIPADYFVSVGVYGDGGYELDPYAYAALQSLGLDTNVIIDLGDGFAMLGKKGAAPGSRPYVLNKAADTDKNAILETCMITCDSSCKTCQNSFDNCLTCLDGDYFNVDENTCHSTCPADKIQIESPSKQCISCDVSCATCTSLAVCQSCNNGYYLYNNSCQATCPDGYYPDNNLNECVICNSACLTCTGSSNTDCIDCQTTPQYYFMSSDSTCYATCPTGYYPSDTTNPKSCQQCTSGCATCTSNSDCQSCSSGYYLANNSCSTTCPNGLFQNDATNECDSCDSTCETCSGPASNECITCKSSPQHYFMSSDSSCYEICPDGYYASDITNPKSCETCPSGCATCTSNSDCQSCSSGYYLANNSCSTTCPNGLFPNNVTNECDSCDATCETCSGPASNECITCKSSPQHYFMSSDSSCYETCPDGYYASDITNPKSCEQCPSGCATCTSNSDCQSCSSGYYLVNNSCSTTCPSGLFQNDVTNECDSCDSTCETCSGPASNECITCKFSPQHYYMSTDSSCYETCPDGYYGSDITIPKTCVTCTSGCATCTSNSDCQSCSSGYYLANNSCSTTCPNGLFQNDATNECDSCDSTCETCSGPASNECITCKSSPQHYFMSSDSSCYETCPDGYYSSDITNPKSCEPCDISCATCTSNSVCQSCNSGYFLTNNSCQSSCPDGQYPENATNECTQCDSNCLTCTGPTSTDCASCSNSPQKYFLASEQKCYATCPDGYFADENASPKSCEQCHSNCETCDSLTTCQSCNQGYQLVNDFCESPCPDGQYYDENDQNCYNCDSSCKTCIEASDTDCLSCPDSPQNYYLQAEMKCYLTCPTGYYNDSANNACTSCPSTCQSCTDQNTCQSCTQGNYLDQTTNTCSSTCQDGTYADSTTNNCEQCDSSCSSCTGNTAQDCSECQNGYFLLESESQCYQTCPQGYQSNAQQQPAVCQEICGDGLRVDPSTECDDGNTDNGDGCDGNCTIEQGWTCSGGSYSQPDTCINENPKQLTYKVKQQKAENNYDNLYENESMDFLIEFSDSFELDSDEYFSNPKYEKSSQKSIQNSQKNRNLSSSSELELADLIQLKFQGLKDSAFKILNLKKTDDQDKNDYLLQLKLNRTVRNRKLFVSFLYPELFLGKNSAQLQQNNQESTEVENYFYYTDHQRQVTENVAFLTEILIIILIILSIIHLIINRFWIAVISLENMQLIFMIGFLDLRLPINGYFFYNKIHLFSNFYLKHFFKLNNNSQSFYILGDESYNTNVIEIAAPFFQILIFLAVIHLIFKCLSSKNMYQELESQNKQSQKPKYKYSSFSQLLRYILINILEFRIWNDLVQAFLGIFIFALIINVKYFTIDQSIIGKFIIASFIIFVFIMLRKIYKNAQQQFAYVLSLFDNEQEEDISKEQKLAIQQSNPQYKFRNLFHHLNIVSNISNLRYIFIPTIKKTIQALIVLIFQYEITAGLAMLLIFQLAYVIYLIIKRPFKRGIDQLHIILTELLVAISLMLFLNLIKDEKEEETSRFHFTNAPIYLFIICLIIHDFHLLFDLLEQIAIRLRPYICPGTKLYRVSNIRSKRRENSTNIQSRRYKEYNTEEEGFQQNDSQYITYETERKANKAQKISQFAQNNIYNQQNLPLKSRFSPIKTNSQSPQSQLYDSYNLEDDFKLEQPQRNITRTRQKNNTVIGYPQNQTQNQQNLQPQSSNKFKEYIQNKKRTYLQQNFMDKQQQLQQKQPLPQSPSQFSNYQLNRLQQQALQDSQSQYQQQPLTPQARIRQKAHSNTSYLSDFSYYNQNQNQNQNQNLQQQQILQHSPRQFQYSPNQSSLIGNNYTNNDEINSINTQGSVKYSRRKNKANTFQANYQI